VRTVRALRAGQTTVYTGAIFTSETRDTIVRVVATRLNTKAPSDGSLAPVRRVGTVGVGVASAAPSHEAAREVLATGRQANFAYGTRGLVIAKLGRIRTGGTQLRGLAPGAAAIRGAAIGSGVGEAAVEPAIFEAPIIGRGVQVRAGIWNRSIANDSGWDRRGRGFTTAGHGQSDQQSVSKEAHDEGTARGGCPG
jgi:hypothetical protein